MALSSLFHRRDMAPPSLNYLVLGKQMSGPCNRVATEGNCCQQAAGL